MVFTYTHLLGIGLALIYFIASFFANRIERLAFENATRDEQFIIFRARPDIDEYGIKQTVGYFVGAIFLAYFINTFQSFTSSFISDPIGIAVIIVTVLLMELKDRLSGDFQKDKLEEERAEIASSYLTQSYLKAERRAKWLYMIPLAVFFIYLVVVY